MQISPSIRAPWASRAATEVLAMIRHPRWGRSRYGNRPSRLRWPAPSPDPEIARASEADSPRGQSPTHGAAPCRVGHVINAPLYSAPGREGEDRAGERVDEVEERAAAELEQV